MKTKQVLMTTGNQGIKIKKISLFNGFLFFISPLLALPSLFYGVYKKNNFSLILLILFAALITYQLVPSDTKDLYQFYRFYKDSLNMSFSGFLDELSLKPDFIVYFLIYFFSKTGLSAQILFATLTFITLYNIYMVYNKVTQKIQLPNSYYFLGVIIIFFSLELLGLYSGIRNLLAASILLVAFYKGYFEQKRKIGIALLILAFFTHFSMALFFPVYVFGVLFPLKRKLGLSIYLLSFLFLFISKQNLYDFLMVFPLSEALIIKVEFYLLGLDSLEKGFLESNAAYISHLIRISWIYFAHIYILITYNRVSSFRFIVILLLCVLNFFSMTTDIQLRATYFIQPMFIFLLFYEFNYKYNKLLIKLFFVLILPSFIVNLMVYRDYFIESLFNTNFLTLIGILLKKVELIFLW